MDKIIPMPGYEIARNGGKTQIHKECVREIEEIVKRTGNKTQFQAHYNMRLDYLEEHRENACVMRKWFERLKYVDIPLYSLHIAVIDNMRILYVFIEDRIYLLCAFSEKSSGRRKSYKQYIEVAKNRIPKKV